MSTNFVQLQSKIVVAANISNQAILVQGHSLSSTFDKRDRFAWYHHCQQYSHWKRINFNRKIFCEFKRCDQLRGDLKKIESKIAMNVLDAFYWNFIALDCRFMDADLIILDFLSTWIICFGLIALYTFGRITSKWITLCNSYDSVKAPSNYKNENIKQIYR